MKNVAYLGSKDLGYECLRSLFFLKDELQINIVAVLTNKKRSYKVIEFCNNNDLTLLVGLDNYLELEEVDIAISVQYHKILKIEHINKAREITINLHMAPLPEYRGCNQFSYAIINNDKEFGTTIHRLEEGIDSGAILFEKRFQIPQNCWVSELYDITYHKSIELFKVSIPKIIAVDYKLKPQKNYLNERSTSLHYRREIEDLKCIDLQWTKEKIERYIRASYMPGFEPPYFLINNEKIYFKKESDL